jgi:hypothetical protein
MPRLASPLGDLASWRPSLDLSVLATDEPLVVPRDLVEQLTF